MHDFKVGDRLFFNHASEFIPCEVVEVSEQNLRVKIKGWMGLQWYPAKQFQRTPTK